MAHRERWEVKLKCPGCGAEGVAEISENNAMYVPLERDVDSISSGFTELSAQLHCLKCQTEF
jgi:hypothetical protein